ncbi:glycosyltransferase family 9 protein [Rhodopirellula halodulae]|uniref:glycosyltransferase family 9 protein n=1 Tax=Rhodopirellula halodulae TaxID=2894198 RepID=UPI001E62AB39|nr:glycosyltransferase family 9 protein [Rhodopirellula sp. JC737]MCC9656890.1 glycosyltransferase family 9 protein [Rhodopirellula sp. JC737]
MSLESPSSMRVLLSQSGDLSDCILTLPMACSLRDHFPDATIAMAVSVEGADFLNSHAAIDEVIQLPTRWNRSPRGIRSVKQQLTASSFDVAIDCHDTFVSALACQLSGAERRIGWDTGPTFAPRRGLLNELVTPVFHHVVDQRLELLTPLSIDRPRARFDWPVSSEDHRWAMRYRHQWAGRDLVLMDTGRVSTSVGWMFDRYAATARYIADRYGMHTIVTWRSFEERLKAEQVVSCAAGTATLAPDLTLDLTAALCPLVHAVIAEDTPVLHAAVAAGANVVGLYGEPEGPLSPSARGPYQMEAFAMQPAAQTAFGRGGLNRREAIQRIGVEHVCQWLDKIQAADVARAA